jgi:ATP-dependent protease ClpP protease subunit
MSGQDKTRQWYKITGPGPALLGGAVNPALKGGGTPKRATVHIYDEIGMSIFGGVDAAELVAEIEALDVDELDVRINSPGGYAFDGLNIANAILRHKAKTTTYIDGLAASAASIVALAGESVVMSKYGQMMLHNAHAVIMGGAQDLRDAAKVLDKLNESIATFYADRAGGDAAAWAKAMSRETWYNADEALTSGLATEIDDSAKREDVETAAANAMACAAHLKFRFNGRQAAGPPNARATAQQQEAPVPTISEKLAERLGLAADASDDDVIAKFDELKTASAQAAAATSEEPTEPAADPGAISQVAAAAAKLGLTVTLPEELAELKRNAAAGARAEAARVQADREAFVDAAIASGRILARSRDNVLQKMAVDDKGMRDAINTLQPEAAIPLTELGHATEPAGADAELKARVEAWKF